MIFSFNIQPKRLSGACRYMHMLAEFPAVLVFILIDNKISISIKGKSKSRVLDVQENQPLGDTCGA